MNTVHGMIAFLRGEADLAEARAKQLRLTAALIQANHERQPSSTERNPPKKRKKRDDDADTSVARSAPASRAGPDALMEDDPQLRHPYGMGYNLFLQTHLSEIDKQQKRHETTAGRDAVGSIRRRRGGGGGNATSNDDKEGLDQQGDDVLAALEHKWIAADDMEKQAWQKRAEQMHQATGAATDATKIAAESGQRHDASRGAVAAAAEGTTTGLDYDDGDDDEGEEEEDEEEEEGDDDDKLEPLDDTEGDDDWGDRKLPATKKQAAPV